MGNFEIDFEDFLAYWLIGAHRACRDAIKRDDHFEFSPDSGTEISNSDIKWVKILF